MTPNKRILHVTVGEPLSAAAARAAAAMKAVQAGRKVEPYFGIGFADVGPMLAVFTPRRWALVAALREGGPMTVAELARRLDRNYKNVHADVQRLMQWMAVERAEDGRVNVPWSEIVVDMKLPLPMAA